MIRKITLLVISLLILSATAKASQEAFQIDLIVTEQEIELERVFVSPAFIPDRLTQPSEGFRLVVNSFSLKKLHEFYFRAPVYFPPFDDDPVNGFPDNGGSNKFSLIVPYFQNAKNIDIFNPNNEKILTIDVSVFAQVCGDSVCQDHESYESCSQDCQSGGSDDYCDGENDGVCDLDCQVEQDINCQIEPEIDNLPLILLVAYIVIVIAGVIILIVKRKKTVDIMDEEYEGPT